MLVLTDERNFSNIGNAIRAITGDTSKFLPSEMGSAIQVLFGADTFANGLSIRLVGNATRVVSHAFESMSNAVEAIFSKCVNVEQSAFRSCSNLRSVSMTQCATIGACAFQGDANLSYAAISRCREISANAFDGCTNLGTVGLPSCSTIGSSAFYGCKNMTRLELPECQLVYDRAFALCTALTYANLSVCDYVRPYVFASCYSLVTTSIPMCSSVGSYGFAYCSMLASVSMSLCKSVGAYAFVSCKAISSVSLPSCSRIGDYAFASCLSLKSISLPSCEVIGSNAFYRCYSISVADIPACSIIYPGGFQECSSLHSVNNEICTSIGTRAFFGCPDLSTASFPHCSFVGDSAFRVVDNVSKFYVALSGAYFPECVTLGSCVFVCRCGMSFISFPKLKSVLSATFWGCSSLTAVDLPNCWSIIGNTGYGAFERAGVETVSLPTCRNIGDRAFFSCYSLMSLYMLGTEYVSLPSQRALWSTPLSLSSYTGSFGSIYVPDWMLSTYLSMANWSVYSARFVGLSLSTGSLVSAFGSFNLISANGASIAYQSVEDREFGVDTFSAGHEGFNIELTGLTANKEYTLEFTLQFIDSEFAAVTSYRVGFMVTADPRTDYSNYSQWPNNISRDNEQHTYRTVFKAASDKAYWSFALDGLKDRKNYVNISDITVRESEWVA